MKNKKNDAINSDVQMNIHQFYIKEINFSSPHMPEAFSFEWKPTVNFNIEVSYKELSELLFEVVLDHKVNLQLEQKGKLSDVCELNIKQGGVFSVKGKMDEAMKNQLLLIQAPTVLYPHIIEMVSSLLNRAGFPQVVLPLVSFEPSEKE